ncbi:hypothetical protein [Neolewinella agarilytica]|uniref:L,D-transpeptidase catalytic domain n=1 Tax=Neolewinella agarilytica TaxID=478744 RepID=A0A1H9H9H8_9BACT|nr:hypothetical protein [Neolewinella agarilytica]SEQ58982.1 hypothetical protein SAMN05444359_11270 [Neolewinella agarilytica]
MIKPTIEALLRVMKHKGYKVYDKVDVDWNLNIIGIRNRNPVPDKFDDTLVVFHRFLGDWHITYYPVTTDPSVKYLKEPILKKGTAILKEGQYLGAYTIRPHNGKYLALCQSWSHPTGVSVYRNQKGSGTLIFDESTLDHGARLGINIHKGPRSGNWDSETKNYSKGCTVFADSRHFEEFMLKCRFGKEAFGNSFTYTLLNEVDFDLK